MANPQLEAKQTNTVDLDKGRHTFIFLTGGQVLTAEQMKAKADSTHQSLLRDLDKAKSALRGAAPSGK